MQTDLLDDWTENMEQFAYQIATALNNLGGYLTRICLAKDYGA